MEDEFRSSIKTIIVVISIHNMYSPYDLLNNYGVLLCDGENYIAKEFMMRNSRCYFEKVYSDLSQRLAFLNLML